MRERLGPLWWHTALTFAANRLGDVFAVAVSLFVVPVFLDAGELGTIEPLLRLGGFGAIPVSVLGYVAIRYLSGYHARGEFGKIRALTRDLAGLTCGVTAVVIVVLLALGHAVRARLHLESQAVYVLALVLVLVSAVQPLAGFLLQGTQSFRANAAGGVLSGAVRLLLALALCPALGLGGYLVAVIGASLAYLALAGADLRRYFGHDVPLQDYRAEWKGMARLAVPVAIYLFAINLQLFVEPFVIRHWLPTLDAAGYYMGYRLGMIPVYLVGALGFVLYPLLAHRHARGETTAEHMGQAVGVTLACGMFGTAALGSLAPWLFRVIPAWRPYADYAPYVWGIAAVAVVDSLIALLAYHAIAKHRATATLAIAVPAICECVFLYVCFGWGAFQDMVPPALWQQVYDAVPRSLALVIGSMFVFRCLALAGLMANHLHRRLRRA